MVTTTFTRQSSIYRTTLEGSTLKLEGTVTITKDGFQNPTGQIYTKEGQFVGSYGELTVQALQPENFAMMQEAWQLRTQLQEDLNAKKEELTALN